MSFTLEEIQQLLASVQEHKITKLKIKDEDYSLEIKGPWDQVVISAAPPATLLKTGDTHPSAGPLEEKPPETGQVVFSPIVGTFYQSPAPEKPAYVAVGSKVNKGDVLFIIESMKLMNEVTSDFTGTVTKIHVKDGETVEYGQPLLTIE